MRDWWEQHSGKCSCKNMKLFLPKDLEENIGVSFCSKSWECVNGKETREPLPCPTLFLKAVC